jgi:hypothetical protein
LCKRGIDVSLLLNFLISVMSSAQKTQRCGAVRATARLMLLLWIAAFTLAACPELHEFFHADARDAAHHCLVTHLEKQSVTTSAAPLNIPSLPQCFTEAVSTIDSFVPASRDYRLSPSRAPPSAVLAAVAG